MQAEDWVYVLEFARIATACVPDEIMDQLDITDNEYLRIRNLIERTLEEGALTELAEDIMDAYCVWVEDDPDTGYGHYEFRQPE